jgi:hypothetical protein
MPATNNPWLILLSILFTGLTSIGIKEIVQGFLKRRPKPAKETVDVTNQVTLAEFTQNYAEKVEKDAEQYRISAQKAWALVDEANRKLVRVTGKLDESTWKLEQAARYMDSVIGKILEPDATIEGVREYIHVRPAPFSRRNGTG